MGTIFVSSGGPKFFEIDFWPFKKFLGIPSMIFDGFGRPTIRSKNNFFEKVDFSSFQFLASWKKKCGNPGQKLKSRKIDFFKKLFLLRIVGTPKPPKIMLGMPRNLFKWPKVNFEKFQPTR